MQSAGLLACTKQVTNIAHVAAALALLSPGDTRGVRQGAVLQGMKVRRIVLPEARGLQRMRAQSAPGGTGLPRQATSSQRGQVKVIHFMTC